MDKYETTLGTHHARSENNLPCCAWRIDQSYNVLVYLDDGVGEAAAVPYYGETQAGIIEYLKSVPDLGDDPFDIDSVLSKRPAGSRAARSAIDEALHDLWGKKLGQPLYKLFGLNPNHLPLTSFTIGIDEPEIMAEQARDCRVIPFSKSNWAVKKTKRSCRDSQSDGCQAVHRCECRLEP